MTLRGIILIFIILVMVAVVWRKEIYSWINMYFFDNESENEEKETKENKK